MDLFLTSMGLLGMQSFLSWGAEYTIAAHADILSSLTSTLIVAFRVITCKQWTNQELLGSFVAIIGCVITTCDPTASKTSEIGSNLILFGDSLCVLSSLFATLYIVKGQGLSTTIPVMHYLVLLTGMVTIIFYLVFPIIFPQEFDFTFDSQTGLFGWLAKDNILYSLLVISLINGCGALYLQGIALQYFSGIIVASTMFIEPVASAVYGYWLGVDEWPGILTLIGGLISLIGLYTLVENEEKERS